MDEVFGKENFVAEIIFMKTSGQTSRNLAPSNDYLLWYAKDVNSLKYRQLFIERANTYVDAAYNYVQYKDGYCIKALSKELFLLGQRFRIV